MEQETQYIEETDQTIIDKIFSEKKEYEDATREKRQEFVDIYNAYIGKMDSVERTPWGSDEYIPKLRTEIAYIVPYIFSGEPEFELEGVGDEDKFGAKILEKILNFRLRTIPDSYEKIESWVKQGCAVGTSTIQAFWKFSRRENIEEDNGTKTFVVVTDEPDLQVINQMDIFYNPTIQNIDDQPSIIVRTSMKIQEVKECPYFNENKTKVETKGNQDSGNYDSSYLTRSDYSSYTGKNSGMIDIYERYTVDSIQTIADGRERILLRNEKLKKKGYDFVKFIFEGNMIPNRADGFGVGQNTLSIGKLYHKMFNQTLQNIKLINNPMFEIRRNANIDKRQLVSKPAGGIEVEAIGSDIRPILFPDLKAGAQNFILKIEDEHKRASGASDLIQGSASNSTLGQDQLAQSNSANRFEIIQRHFRSSLSKLGKKLLELELENLQDMNASILRIFPSEDRETVFNFLINNAKNIKYDIRIRGNTTVSRNRDIESKRLVDIYNLASSPSSPVQMSPKEARAFLRRIAERQGEQNIDDIIGEEPEIETQEQNMSEMNENETSSINPNMLNNAIVTARGLNQQASAL